MSRPISKARWPTCISTVSYTHLDVYKRQFYNVVNPDYIVDNYGADTLRMYEMFLGPLEQSKPCLLYTSRCV